MRLPSAAKAAKKYKDKERNARKE